MNRNAVGCGTVQPLCPDGRRATFDAHACRSGYRRPATSIVRNRREWLTHEGMAEQVLVKTQDGSPDNRSAPDAIAAEIRARIWNGQFAPGQRLIENDLVLDLRASRSSVREALRVLAAQGLATFEMNRGARVRRFSRTECLSLIQIREALEGLATGLAAERANSDDVARLLAIHHRAADAIERHDPGDYLQINDTLHQAIIAISGNSMIQQHLFLSHIALFRIQTRFLRSNELHVAQAEHLRIIRAIEKNDPRGAEDTMRSHVGATREIVLEAPASLFELEIGSVPLPVLDTETGQHRRRP